MTNLEKLQQAFTEGLSIESNQVHPDLHYQGIAEWDSMSHMFLIEALQQHFAVEFETEDILEMTSYKDIIEILKKHSIQF